nr:MAG TPA: hypothetical protein [Inoviridae sp.]
MHSISASARSVVFAAQISTLPLPNLLCHAFLQTQR